MQCSCTSYGLSLLSQRKAAFPRLANCTVRSPQSVSHILASLEKQVGFALFERAGRDPQLTEAGRALMADPIQGFSFVMRAFYRCTARTGRAMVCQ